MPGRKYSAGSGYRYGFNRKENAEEIAVDDYDFGARIYDGRIGRWLCTDPLQKKYPEVSPYNFVENNPIAIIDQDGKDWIITTTKDSKGIENIKITFTGAILNSSYASVADVAKFKDAAIVQIQEAYTKSFTKTMTEIKNISGLDGVNVPILAVKNNVSVNVSIEVNLRVITNSDQLDKNEHLIEIVPKNALDKEGSKTTTRGRAGFFGKYVRINETALPDIISNTNKKTVPHELGHTAGLYHPNEGSGIFGYFKSEQNMKDGIQDDNLMYQGKYQVETLKNTGAGNNMSIKQIGIMQRNYKGNKLNKNNIPVKVKPDQITPSNGGIM